MTDHLPHTLTDGDEGSELLRHLLSDFLIKGVIVVVALLVLAVGMAAIWKAVGKGGARDGDR
ncbi:hypothetical protein [Streptosporangium carneum]|uniref:Uncharacterized protein n=1 Tax=Streptosporangium carneum TaxID=47481 RepID=A0A9W6I5U7_9ACTN|nr:hypothetical protein [Streptosporangium carneum]GLK11509.1 hypothetical protein GCM10017600_49160 [Streptosporangium carneum]